MDRRRAIAVIAACTVLGPIPARGQQQKAPRRIGYFSAASAAANAPRLAAFRQGMTAFQDDDTVVDTPANYHVAIFDGFPAGIKPASLTCRSAANNSSSLWIWCQLRRWTRRSSSSK